MMATPLARVISPQLCTAGFTPVSFAVLVLSRDLSKKSRKMDCLCGPGE